MKTIPSRSPRRLKVVEMKAMNEMMKSEQFLEKAAAVDKVGRNVGMNLQKKQAFPSREVGLCVFWD